eukprot:352472-Chlamydomonas_euryale.AAC.2
MQGCPHASTVDGAAVSVQLELPAACNPTSTRLKNMQSSHQSMVQQLMSDGTAGSMPPPATPPSTL